VERVLERHSAVIGAAIKATENPTGPPHDAAVPETGAAPSSVELSVPQPPGDPCPKSPRLQAEQSKRQRRIDRFEQVHELHRRGPPAGPVAPGTGPRRGCR